MVGQAGALRKCKPGAELRYTNSAGAPGSQDLALERGTRSVVNEHSAALARQRQGAAPAEPLEPDVQALQIERALAQCAGVRG